MVQVIERAERDCGVQELSLSEVGERGVGRLVLECGCGESFALDRPGVGASVGKTATRG